MERILVITDNRFYPWNALSRAVELAKRINAGVFILKVLCSEDQEDNVVEEDMKTSAGRRLENMIQAARTDLVRIEYLVTKGDFEEEVIRFVEGNKISILVVEQESLEIKMSGNQGKGSCPMKDIFSRIPCKVELVSPKKSSIDNKKGER